jgi:hypothetical protein
MARGSQWPGAQIGLAVLLSSAVACTFTAHVAAPRDGGAGTGKDAGTIGVGAGNGDGAPAGVIGGGPLGDAACAAHSQVAQRLPLDLYMMMDSSGSMTELTATGVSKWDAVRSAMTSFLQDPQSAGLGVGLQYFPLLRANVPDACSSDAMCNGQGPCNIARACNSQTNAVACNTNADCPTGITCELVGGCLDPGGNPITCLPARPGFVCNNDPADPCLPIGGYCANRDICTAASYATPAVEVAPLPGAAAALLASLNAHTPDGLTPTSGALSGAITHAQALARANPTHRVAVVLATDGLPSECTPVDIPSISAIASTAAAGTPAISTFVIGVFSQAEAPQAQPNLDALAAAGGTQRAFVISTNQNVATGFVSALNAIRTTGLSCQYAIPAPPPDGGTLDFLSVNVEFTSGAGQTVTIGNVPNQAGCSATKGGWYYDVDPRTGATPHTISICEPTCTQLRADTAGRVDILLGCQTEVIVP